MIHSKMEIIGEQERLEEIDQSSKPKIGMMRSDKDGTLHVYTESGWVTFYDWLHTVSCNLFW